MVRYPNRSYLVYDKEAAVGNIKSFCVQVLSVQTKL